MATGRKTVVVGQVIDPVAWGNPLWDQSVQTFASAADRTAQFPAPKQGAVTWLEDIKALQVFNGTGWVGVEGPADVPWFHFTTFGAGWSAFASAPYDGVWGSRRGGVVTLMGAVTKSSAAAANDIPFQLVGTPLAASAPLHNVPFSANNGTALYVRTDGWVLINTPGTIPFSFSITYVV